VTLRHLKSQDFLNALVRGRGGLLLRPEALISERLEATLLENAVVTDSEGAAYIQAIAHSLAEQMRDACWLDIKAVQKLFDRSEELESIQRGRVLGALRHLSEPKNGKG
jgi:hypothetical protein